MNLLARRVAAYLDELVPPRPARLAELEVAARRTGFPIIGPATGHLCYLLARLSNARHVFELGSGFGYSTAWFARAVKENGGGTVHHVVWDEQLSREARQNLAALGLADVVQFHVGEAVAALQHAAGPCDVIFNDIDKQDYPKALDDIERLRVVLLVDIVEDDVERPGSVLQRRHRLPYVELDHISQAEGREVLPRFAGQLLVPDDVVHGPAAVFLHGAREPRGRVAEARAEFEDVSSVAEACQQVAQVSCRGADDGEAGAPRRHLELGEPCGAGGDELVQIRGHASGQEVHGYASITDRSAGGISISCARPPRASPPARTAAPD